MKILRSALLVVGVLATLLGLIWIGQGSGYFPYPASSFMINETPWIYRGLILAVVGVLVIFVSRRGRS
jgi:hypothetical protein